MSLVSKGSSLPCCVESTPEYSAKARYALTTLLMPLGLEPEWTLRPSLARGIYYGAAPPESEQVLRLPLSPAAEEAYARLEPVDLGRVTWFESREGRLPAVFSDPAGRPDLVASAFFLLSGWQEATSSQRDEHGRYPFEGSFQMLHGLACTPVVDAYREIVAGELRTLGVTLPRRTWGGKSWALCPTHDVDYLRKWRPGILYRELVQPLFQRSGTGRTIASLRQLFSSDPYRGALRRMPEEVLRRGGTATYFFKTGAEDPHDVAYRLRGRFGSRLVARLKETEFEIALHPSYPTPENPEMLAREKRRLEAQTGAAPTSVRQHYLRFDPQTTPRLHATLGFRIDSTLGFSEHEGFRRGTCLPFRIYDLVADEALDLWEMPLAVMDSTLFSRRGMDAARAIETTHRLAEECRRYGGALVALWHNMLWDEVDCPGWGRHFTDTLDLAEDEGAMIASLEKALRSWA